MQARFQARVQVEKIFRHTMNRHLIWLMIFLKHFGVGSWTYRLAYRAPC
mgnify:CR=1 FL=1